MAATSKRPNFLIILADDLGFTDLGCYGSEIKTPNVDRLAAEGVVFSDYHVAPYCSPTRSMILSGTDSHLAGLGAMSEFAEGNRDRWNKPGHEGYLNKDVAALPALLHDAGYFTLLTGKWHLGYRRGQIPHDRGFDRSYTLLPGCSNHYGWEPDFGDEANRPHIAAHHPPIYLDGDKRTMPQPNTTNTKGGFYSSDAFADNFLGILKGRTSDEKEKPFFGYLAYSAVHWPLQCLPEDRDRHQGMYKGGPDVLRLERLKRLIKLGIMPPDVKPHPYRTKATEWADLTSEQKRISSRTMEVYAGMVHAMDGATGRVLDYLEQTGELDNTVVMFMSDNGAAGAELEAKPITKMGQALEKWYDNSYENLGNHDSFCWYGARWAQAGSAPLRQCKRVTAEGGIRVPLVLRFPKWAHYPPGSVCKTFGTCMDIVPTFLELAGAQHPNPDPPTSTRKVKYNDQMVYPMRGKSWNPYFSKGVRADGAVQGESDAIHAAQDAPVGWEIHGAAGIRYLNWKAVNIPVEEGGTGDWELFDLSEDPGETENLAEIMPDKLMKMQHYWDDYVKDTGVVWGVDLEKTGPKVGPTNYDLNAKRTVFLDYIGGDYVEDMKEWMRLGEGETLPV